VYTVKKGSDFPVPRRDMSLTKLSNYSRPRRVWVTDIPAGNGKIDTLYFTVLEAFTFAMESEPLLNRARALYFCIYSTVYSVYRKEGIEVG
jgi:hypothetical protein